jgi:curved DNA-binding protein CbpA
LNHGDKSKEDALKEVTAAYNTLSDPYERRLYDATLQEERRPPPEARRSYGDTKFDGVKDDDKWYAHHYGNGRMDVEYQFTEEDKKMRASENFDGDSAATQRHAGYYQRKEARRAKRRADAAAAAGPKKEEDEGCVVS